jgi:hypothetical protein
MNISKAKEVCETIVAQKGKCTGMHCNTCYEAFGQDIEAPCEHGIKDAVVLGDEGYAINKLAHCQKVLQSINALMTEKMTVPAERLVDMSDISRLKRISRQARQELSEGEKLLTDMHVMTCLRSFLISSAILFAGMLIGSAAVKYSDASNAIKSKIGEFRNENK